jgi:hypothetical protein
MNTLIKAELTAYGVDPARFGLLGAVVAARNLSRTGASSAICNTWAGTLTSEQVDDLLTALVKLSDVPFELHLATSGDFSVFVYTPRLGLSSANTDSIGNVVITEHRLRELMRLANQSMPKFQRFVCQELLEPWFNEFEEAIERSAAPQRNAVVA